MLCAITHSELLCIYFEQQFAISVLASAGASLPMGQPKKMAMEVIMPRS
jgi:hypothetical protein